MIILIIFQCLNKIFCAYIMKKKHENENEIKMNHIRCFVQTTEFSMQKGHICHIIMNAKMLLASNYR